MDKQALLLLEGCSRAAWERDMRGTLRALAGVMRRLLSAGRCDVFLLDQASGQLWTPRADGLEDVRVLAGAGLAARVLATGEALCLGGSLPDPNPGWTGDPLAGRGVQTLLAHRLRGSDATTLGLIRAGNKETGGDFTAADIALLERASPYLAACLKNALVVHNLTRTVEEVVIGLSHATRYKDPESRNHLVRMGLYCADMASRLGWPSEDIETARLAAPMHDIGKAGVPDHILQKPEKLNPDEWELMQRHSEYGYELLKTGEGPLMRAAAQTALEHHEKWNGRGYPSGKKAESISIYARLIAIADVFDALTSKRCYKEAWPFDKALHFIKTQSGEHFDPKLAGVFLDQADGMIRIKEHFPDQSE